MKVSREWLQKYFDDVLPEGQALADAFTFHSFEVEEQEGNLIDLKVLPDRAGYALSHRGVASELAAALDRPMKRDQLREPLPMWEVGHPTLQVEIEDPERCPRYMAALVKGVKVGPSPDWLRGALESVGQRSINNIVDATNYVMLDIGQPLHAFDASKLETQDGAVVIAVRRIKSSGSIQTLDSVKRLLPDGILAVVDGHSNNVLAIAGIKGGKAAEVTFETTDILIESANFDAVHTRRSAQRLKLFTDASLRFQNRPSPELAAYGVREVLKLITEMAGGEVVGVVDEYPNRPEPKTVSVTLGRVNRLLGSSFSREEALDAFRRLALPVEADGDTFTVTPPFERTDLAIPEDLVEEVGRILGYDRIKPVEMPPLEGQPDQARFRGIERMKDELVEQGFIEVSTQSFAQEGDIVLANPLDKTRPALRTSLEGNLADALERAKRYAPLVLPPGQNPKLFEIGTVFPGEGEYLELRMTEPAWEGVPTHDDLSVAKLEEYGKSYEPKRYELGMYEPFSAYPFVLRDIAVWAPEGAGEAVTSALIRENAGELLRRTDLFDTFEKGSRTSYAYQLVFESPERTLTDEEVTAVMECISAALAETGYEIR